MPDPLAATSWSSSESSFVTPPWPPPWNLVEDAVERALAEDVGLAGDVTSIALVDPDAVGRGAIAFRAAGVLAGTWTTDAVCERYDLYCAWDASDGDRIGAGDVVGVLEGNLADLLCAERTILNFLGQLSGVATLTGAFVDAVARAGTRTRIRDTRKTVPGLRGLQKAAVRAGGGVNHRMGLFDAVLVKDNHLVAFDGAPDRRMAEIVARCRSRVPGVTVEIEVEDLLAADAAAAAGADLILLDNMTPDEAAEVVAVVGGRCPIEISGGVTLATIDAYAAVGATYIAIGALTHSAPCVDVGLDLLGAAPGDDDFGDDDFGDDDFDDDEDFA